MIRILTFVFITVNIIVTFGAAIVVYTQTLGTKPIVTLEDDEYIKMMKAREGVASHSIFYTLPPVVVNLKDRPIRTMKIELSFELFNEEGFEEIVNLGGRSKDAIVSLLNTKSFFEIESIQGKLALKDQIITTINHSLKKGVVAEVYFSEFVVQ